MTPEEMEEMKGLMLHMTNKMTFEHGYRMGFIAGKLSAVNHIMNHSPLYNGKSITGSEGQPSTDSAERVGAPGQKRNTRPVHRKRQDKGSAG